MKEAIRTVQAQWGVWLRRPSFLAELALSCGAVILISHSFVRFLSYVEYREGVVLPDPILSGVTAVDLTYPIFILLWGGIVVGVFHVLPDPRRLAMGIQVFGTYIGFRFLMMYLVPLAPPPGMIDLVDPITGMAGTDRVPTRDLFFSGHTATLCFFFLLSNTKLLRWMLGLSAVVVGSFLLWQKAHYTIDVAVAPFVVYGAFGLVRWLRERAGLCRV